MSKFKGAGLVVMGREGFQEAIFGYEKIFIVCDPFLVDNDGVKYITNQLDNYNVNYKIYSNIVPDPHVEIVANGTKELLDFEPDLVIGFGGGSAIDACKAMIYFSRKVGRKKEVKFMAIPTTSGTGSEVTDFSVISNRETSMKYPLVDYNMLPDIAVLDPNLTLTVPPAITAATGMDVLTHAIEAMLSKEATDFSDAMAEKSIKLIRKNLVTTFCEPNNIEARQGMHNASCMAGIAFNNSGLGLNHGMAHALGANFHIPHGMANALLLPYIIGFNAGCYDVLTENAIKYARIARLIHVDSNSVRQSALNLVRYIKKLKKDLNIPDSIKEMGISKEDFKNSLEHMTMSALKDKCTQSNPRSVDFEDIRKLYIHAYFGRIGQKL